MVNKMIFLLSLVVLLFTNELLSQDKKNELFAQLRKRYGNMNSLEAKFVGIEPISGITGTLKAMRSGKYILDLNDRKIICDGHTVWNYHPTRKNVTINEIKSRPSSSLDIVLFNFLYNYQPKDFHDFSIGNISHHGNICRGWKPKTSVGFGGIENKWWDHRCKFYFHSPEGC